MQTIRRNTKVACSDRKISVRSKTLFPRYMQEQNSEFIPIIEAYYRWMEEVDGIQREIYCLTNNSTSQNADEKFLNILAEQFLSCFPQDLEVDKQFLIQNVRELYALKGTEQGIKLLFKLIYGKEPQITYPNEAILRASDGEWQKDILMKIEYIGSSPDDMIGKRIYGVESGQYAMVETQTTIQQSGRPVTNLSLSSVIGIFYPDEIVETLENDIKFQGRILGIVSSYKIVNGGSGYSEGTSIPVSGGDGVLFDARISEVGFSGDIKEIEFLNQGVDYYTQPIVDLSALGDGNAEIELFVGQQYNSLGRFISEKGKLSQSPRLQDGRVYQEFSYVIRSDIPFEEYIRVLKCIAHPGGFEVSGIYQTQDTAEVQPVLFHNSDPYDLINGSINWKHPDSKSSSRYIQHKIKIDSKVQDVEDYVALYGLNGEGELGDFSQDISDFIDRPLQDYSDIQMGKAKLPGIDIFRLHDTFSSLKYIFTQYRSRFYQGQEIGDLFMDSLIEWHFDEEIGEWVALTHREKHVWSEVLLISSGGLELIGGGSLELIGGGSLELISE